MKIKENVILAPYTTFGIGGPARYFCEVKSVEDLKIALKFSRKNNLRFFILGGGNNILFTDNGFNGLVIKIEIKGLEFKDGEDFSILSAGAGENWDYVVGEAVKRNLGGIENLSLIPGTAGAAVYQNIGAYGVELKDVLESAEVLDSESGEIKIFSNKDCRLQYRNSIFKKKEGARFVILKVIMRLSKNWEPKINYPDLIKAFEGMNPSILDVRSAVIEIRKKKLPYPPEIYNAGSFFKNPVVTESRFKNLVLRHPDLKRFNSNSGSVKLSAAQLIEKCGWKGKIFGNVGVSQKHSLVLVNYGNGTAKEVSDLAREIKLSVKDRFGVELEAEVEIIE